MAPLKHAVGFVDGDEIHARGLREGGEIVGEQALRRDVQDAQASPMGHVVDVSTLLRRHSAVDQGGGHSPCLQRLHLVAHERAQRGHDEREMAGSHGGKLVADAFAAAGRHDGDQVPAIEDGVDGFELSGTERLVSVGFVELVQGGLGPVP